MKYLQSSTAKNLLFYFILIIFCCLPIWSVKYFINQDGSAHLHSSYLMLELLKGNSQIAETYSINSLSIPNSSGHWLMTLLLTFLPPFLITKIIVTLTFAGFVAAIGWLRLKTNGEKDLKTALLIGAALGFNWMWFVGFYNFFIGVCCFVFTIGLFAKWRGELNLQRAVILMLLFLLAYFSHLISFTILIGAIFVLLIFGENINRKRNLFLYFLALLPILPLIIIYKSVSVSGGGFFPVWRNLENSFSLLSWLSQIRRADPFIMISRKSFPFYDGNSSFFAIFAPVIWIFSAIICLGYGTFKNRNKLNLFSKTELAFIFLFFSCLFAALFAPDDFGLSNGGVLRERLLLCALIFLIPVFRIEKKSIPQKIAHFCLIFIIIFQTFALWDYSLQTNKIASEYLSVKYSLASNENLASVVILDENLKFPAFPLTMINNNLAVGSSRTVWDNYEISQYYFPVLARKDSDKRFIYDLTRSNAFVKNMPDEQFKERLANLDACLVENHRQITTLLFWGKDSRVEAVIEKWFSPEFSENGRNIHLYRHK